MPIRRAVLVAALLPLLALAQQAEQSETASANEAATSSSAGDTTGQSATEATTGAAATVETTTDASPSDYEASEAISEDLSVSFPVDI